MRGRITILSLSLLLPWIPQAGRAAAPPASGETHDVATGPYPYNEISNQPNVAPPGGKPALIRSVKALQSALTMLRQIRLQLDQAHWNVSGTLFYPLHLMLHDQDRGLEPYADRCAERLLEIGVSVDERPTTIAKTGPLPELPGGFLDDAQVLSWFTLAYQTVTDDLRAAAKDIVDIDPPSAALLDDVEREIGKYQWQMRAEFQSTPSDPNAGAEINNGRPVFSAPGK